MGLCSGIGFSVPMIENSRRRVATDACSFVCADVEKYRFTPDTYDTIVSRFSVIFFADPVSALSNLRFAVRADTNLILITWRDPKENPFLSIAGCATAQFSLTYFLT